MHEWALAEAVLEELAQYVNKPQSRRITRVVLSFGELQSVDLDVFTEGLTQLLGELGLKEKIGADVFTYEDEGASFECRACGHAFTFADLGISDEDVTESVHFLPETAHAFFSCPKCASPDFKMLTGRGVTIRSIVMIEETE